MYLRRGRLHQQKKKKTSPDSNWRHQNFLWPRRVSKGAETMTRESSKKKRKKSTEREGRKKQERENRSKVKRIQRDKPVELTESEAVTS